MNALAVLAQLDCINIISTISCICSTVGILLLCLCFRIEVTVLLNFTASFSSNSPEASPALLIVVNILFSSKSTILPSRFLIFLIAENIVPWLSIFKPLVLKYILATCAKLFSKRTILTALRISSVVIVS